jgi:16S rRNA (adenine1518-N6/adenine1519-N6)-dimethyltransferase
MPPQSSSDHPRAILEAHQLAANRRLGQNFLISSDLMDRLVAASNVGPGSTVLEIGTGLGRLTERLAAAARWVVSVEIDRGLWEAAQARLARLDNVRLVHSDFLESKHSISPAVADAVREATPDGPVRVVSNLPYQISSPALINLLEWEIDVVEIGVMLQAEVVDRLVAEPGSSDYGPLTVFASYHATMHEIMSLPPSAFWPRPEVSSKFLRLVARAPQAEARDYHVFRQVVNRLFQNRRKTISKGLSLGWDRETSRQVLAHTGLDGRRRPATLALEEFVALSDALVESGAG